MSGNSQETEILKKCVAALGTGCIMARFGFDLPKTWEIEDFRQLAEEIRIRQTKISAELQEKVALALLEIAQWLENRGPKMWGPKERQFRERWGGIQEALKPYIRQ